MALSKFQKLLLVGSHSVMLGLGVWWALRSDPPKAIAETGDAVPPPSSIGSASREYQISPTRLLAAFSYDSPYYQAVRAKSSDEKYIPPEERAAQVSDFKKELQAHVDVFNQTGFTDYRYTQEVIYRWVAADPSAALRFFGTVEIRSGWGDPWPALFKNRCDLDGLQIATIVERDWLPYNRKEGREALAAMVGKYHPDQLSEVLGLFESDPASRQRFFFKALASSQGADLGVWFEVISQMDPATRESANQKLASSIIPSGVPSSWLDPDRKKGTDPTPDALASILDSARGTDLEVLVETRLQNLLGDFEKRKAAIAEAEKSSPTKPSPRPDRDAGLKTVARESKAEMQALFNGKLSGATVLQSQIARLETVMAEDQVEHHSQEIMSEIMVLDPVSTYDFAIQNFTEKQIERTFAKIENSSAYSIQRKARMLDELIISPHWEKIPDRDEFLGRTIMDYRKHHLDLAQAWIRNLPPSALDAAKASQPQYKALHRFIDQTLVK
jgi:hypothetical protein